MWNPGSTPPKEGWYIVTVLFAEVTVPKPTTDVLEYRKGKWIFQGPRGKMQAFEGQVLAWMPKPTPYDPSKWECGE